MQLIEPIFQVPADFAGWLAVVAGLATFAALVRRLDPNSKVVTAPVIQDVAVATQPVRRFEPGVEFQKVMDVSLVELIHAPDLRSLQSDASLQIDAAEHALNRLLADCARIGTLVPAPTFEPVRQLAREPAAEPAREQPLAA